jgi:nicotinamidase-related amidase
MRNNILFIIDPQKSFLGYRDGRPYREQTSDGTVMTAELPVAGSVEDMENMVRFIDSDGNGEGIDDIIVTLDTHETIYRDRDIGHPEYWVDEKGRHPAPFTKINYDDIIYLQWLPYTAALDDRVESYLKAVGSHVVWPRHCVLASWGHDIYCPLNDAIDRWIKRTGKRPGVIRKGMNCHTEQFDAFEAAVPDPNDPTTQFNWALLNILKKGTRVWCGGIAKSHCVKTSIEQAAGKLTTEEIARWTLLEDCMSSVTGSEALGDAFVAQMQMRGMSVEKAGS